MAYTLLLVLVATALPRAQASGEERTWTPGDPESERPYWMNSEGGPAHAAPSLLGLLPPSTPPPKEGQQQQQQQYQAPVPPQLFPFSEAELAAESATDSQSATHPSNDATASSNTKPSLYNYTWEVGFLSAGGDIRTLNVSSTQQAMAACTAEVECKAFCYEGNETITSSTTVYLKRGNSHAGGKPWSTWRKIAKVGPPAARFNIGGLDIALRAETFTLQELNKSGVNYSFIPALTPTSGLPLTQNFGDITLRIKPASAAKDTPWAYFASAWGPGAAVAKAVTPLPAGAVAAHDISSLLSATNALGVRNKLPLKVVRAYSKPKDGGPGMEMSFAITNDGNDALRLGSFGMATPSAGGTGNIETNIATDAHIGGEHAWVEWVRVVVDEQTMIATPLNRASKMEAWRPIMEFGGAVPEWATLTAAWAPEWELNRQWPFYYMAESLNATGFWPNPKSPWPCWADGGKTVRTNFTSDLNWNPPTDLVLAPGESVTYGIRLSAAPGGPRTRDAALEAVGEPVLRSVPGYTLSTDMKEARLFVTPPKGATVKNVTSSSKYLTVGKISKQASASTAVVVSLVPAEARGRARVAVGFSDGSEAVGHYYVLPSLEGHLEAVGKHWSEVAWLPRDYPDPFGRGAAVLPWDREDLRHRLNDPRAYDVGLSDDAGGGNPLGFATKVTYAPNQKEVATLDEYIGSTLFGIKDKAGDGAKPPYKSLQVGGYAGFECGNRTNPHDLTCEGIRMTMFYYNQSYFDWKYTEERGCGMVLDNWCMTEAYANATYRVFNYPHHIASYYGMYRVARNHDKMKTEQSWEFYLERAALTVLRMGSNNIGFMDGTIQREVLRSVQEEDAAAGADSTWGTLAAMILKNQQSRAKYWSTAKYPYGSEFAYDTTGQEEVVVWLLYFGYDDAAERTVNHILSYMRSLPGWAMMGGASAGDIGNGGKWYVAAETNWPEAVGKMHYRAGLNQIPLSEWYRLHPDDFQLLEISVGAITGQYTNIDATGAPGMLYNSFPHIQEHDPYSGDYGLGFFGISLESAGYFVNHKTLGPLCYLCDLDTSDLVLSDHVEAANGTAAAAAAASAVAGTFTLTDAYRQRVYFEPLGLWLQADAGRMASVAFNMHAKTLAVTFQAAKSTPAGEQTYSLIRLRADKVARGTSRPGNNFTVSSPTKGVAQARSAWEIEPPSSAAVPLTVTLTWKD